MIQPVIGAAIPPDAAAPGGDSRHTSLPADILQESCRRVSLAAAVFAVMWVLALVVRNLLARSYPGAPGLEGWPMPGTLFASAGLVMSLLLATFSNRSHAEPEKILMLGLVFEVATAALVAFTGQWQPFISPTRISWVCVVILVYPAIAPNTPGKTLVAALFAASMDPLAVWVASLRGVPVDSRPLGLISMFVPN